MNIENAYVKTRGINLYNENVLDIPSMIPTYLKGTIMYDSFARVFKGLTENDAGPFSIGEIAGGIGDIISVDTITTNSVSVTDKLSVGGTITTNNLSVGGTITTGNLSVTNNLSVGGTIATKK